MDINQTTLERIKKHLGEKIKYLRNSNEIKQSILAKQLKISRASLSDYENGKKYVIDFTVKNIEQLVLSSQNDNTTISYINGASLRGCLASNYIKNGGDPSGDEFKKIFLGDTIFDNMYVCHGNDKMIPVPLFIRQLKKTKDIVNICCKEVEGSE